ncbi:hypothetical protein EVAR_17840_1 [Eumeta japonica]|uniref:Uncharacterized protein n=1 Tax=Eumeta variegata TaxID=151549 RepID=A0A4C1TTN3_EUMVA|nr:hypothetical protein EVAR_17840_1 [Eumeta japonica]
MIGSTTGSHTVFAFDVETKEQNYSCRIAFEIVELDFHSPVPAARRPPPAACGSSPGCPCGCLRNTCKGMRRRREMERSARITKES